MNGRESGTAWLIGLVFVLWGALVLFFGLLVMLLWNWLAPIFWLAAPHLTYWQGVGIGLVLGIIGSLLSGSGKK